VISTRAIIPISDANFFANAAHRRLARRLVAVRCATYLAVVAARSQPEAILRPDCIKKKDAADDDSIFKALSKKSLLHRNGSHGNVCRP
jgi:hypothetical protein